MPDAPRQSSSPRYPSQPLKYAVDAIKRLYSRDGMAAIERDVAVQHLGYKGINGASAKSIAAINHFGLLDVAGNGKIKISQTGLGIIHPKNDQEFGSLLYTALLSPKIFEELISQYGSIDALPSDETLTVSLIRERKFQPGGAKECISNLRDSIDFIKEQMRLKAFNLPNGTGKNQPVAVNANPDTLDTPLDSNLSQMSEQGDVSLPPHEIIPIRLSKESRAEIRVYGTVGSKEAKKLKVWMERVVTPWIDLMLDEDEEEDE